MKVSLLALLAVAVVLLAVQICCCVLALANEAESYVVAGLLCGCVMGAMLISSLGGLLRFFSDLSNDLKNLCSMKTSELHVEARPPPKISELRNLNEQLLKLVVSLRETRPFIPAYVLDAMTEGDEVPSPRSCDGDKGVDSPISLEGVPMISITPVPSPAAAKSNSKGRFGLSLSTADIDTHSIDFDVSVASMESAAVPKSVRVQSPLSKQLLENQFPPGAAHKSFSGFVATNNDTSCTFRRSSTSNALNQLRRTSQPLVNANIGNDVKAKKGHALMACMKRRKGTLLSVEYGIMELANDNTADTYELAASLVSSALDIIHAEGGNVVQLTANYILAAWNTHHPCTRHSWNACKVAVELKNFMESMTDDGETSIAWSVAVTTGFLYYGSIGNEKHKSAFVLGSITDHVKQLNNLSRHLRVPVIITEAVQEVVHNLLACRPVDVVLWFDDIMSKSVREIIYEVVDNMPVDPTLWKEAFTGFVSGAFNDSDAKISTLMQKTSSDRQLSRLASLVANAKAKTLNIPEPYVRRMVGWESWEVEQSFEKKFLSGSLEKYKTRSTRRSTSYSANSTHSEDLKLAIELTQRDKSDNSDSDTCSTAHSEDEDTPPERFKDTDGSEWRRSAKQLGNGAFGDVWLGMSEDGSLVALKCMKVPPPVAAARRLSRVSSPLHDTVSSAVKEVEILSKYKDESIVCFISCGVFGKNIIVVMEYVSGGSLASILDQFGSVPSATARRYTKDILRGLLYLHSNDIIHVDLKPANVLLHTDGQCKLSDFGTCKVLTAIGKQAAESKGTPMYMAPEACRGQVSKASDVWSLGHTVIAMLAGVSPFEWTEEVPKGPHLFMRWLCRMEGDVPLPPASLIGEQGLGFVVKLLRRNPAHRPSVDQLVYDSFVL